MVQLVYSFISCLRFFLRICVVTLLPYPGSVRLHVRMIQLSPLVAFHAPWATSSPPPKAPAPTLTHPQYNKSASEHLPVCAAYGKGQPFIFWRLRNNVYFWRGYADTHDLTGLDYVCNVHILNVERSAGFRKPAILYQPNTVPKEKAVN